MDYIYEEGSAWDASNMKVIKTVTLAAEELPAIILPAECSDCHHYNGQYSKVVRVVVTTYEDHSLTVYGYCEAHYRLSFKA